MQASYSVKVSLRYKGQPRPDPVWIGRWTIDGKEGKKVLGKAHKGRGRPPAGYMSEADAERALEAHIRALGATLAIEGSVPFNVVADAYIERLRIRIQQRNFRETTFANYLSIIDRVLRPMWGTEPIASITERDLKALHERFEQRGAAAGTINQHRAVLAGIFRLAVKEFGLSANPIDGFERARTKAAGSGTIDFYTPEEVQQLVEAAESELDAALYLCAGFTGLRAGELRGLRWRAVDFGRSLIHVERAYTEVGGDDLPKSWKTRSVPMMAMLARRLMKLRQRQHFTDPEDLVFCDPLGGYLNYDQMYRRYVKAAQRAGLQKLRFHDLRHSFGTMAVQVFPLSDVRVWMGHADLATTMRYIHFVPQVDAADRLQALVDSSTKSAEVIPITRGSESS